MFEMSRGATKFYFTSNYALIGDKILLLIASKYSLIHPSLKSRVYIFFSKHISGLHTAFRPRDALLSETAWH